MEKMENCGDRACLERVHAHTLATLQKQNIPLLPEPWTLVDARATLTLKLPDHGLGIEKTTDHLLQDIAPSLNGSSLSPNYYGFVTGGITPAARIAESIVSLYDQNPQVHLPDQTVASNVEDKALRLLMDLLHLDQNAWSGVLSTGGTASNILGLACGREYVINQRIRSRQGESPPDTVGSLGLLRACSIAGVEDVHIYTTMAHSSLCKASSILGLGRSRVQHVGRSSSDIAFDLRELERNLEINHLNSVSIVVVSCAEVNTGLFATDGYEQLQVLRTLCDKYGAWLHVDGGKHHEVLHHGLERHQQLIPPVAFGLFARLLHEFPEFEKVAQGAEGMELADSIAGDGHKLLNVPYDCGFFFSRHKGVSQQVFQNPNAAYLNTANAVTDAIQSPLNTGIENSRRFRALPVYASLMAYGRDGYRDMLKRQIRFARAVAMYVYDHDAFELLPKVVFHSKDSILQDIFIIVIFRAKDKELNNELVQRTNTGSKMYVSGTVWDGSPASRIAVSNWQVNPERDFFIVKSVLDDVLRSWSQET